MPARGSLRYETPKGQAQRPAPTQKRGVPGAWLHRLQLTGNLHLGGTF